MEPGWAAGNVTVRALEINALENCFAWEDSEEKAATEGALGQGFGAEFQAFFKCL